MSLVLRVIKSLLLTMLRAAALFLALFVAYLAFTEALPAYRAMAELAAQRPVLDQESMRLESELRRREARAEQARKELEALVESELMALRQNVESFEAALRELDEQRQKLEADLRESLAEEAAYCESWNPLKRWLCNEVRERSARTRATVEPVLAQLATNRNELATQLGAASEALKRYEALPAELRGNNLDAQRLRAEVGEQLYEQAALRDALTQVQARLEQAKLAEGSPWVWISRQLDRVAWRLALIVALVMTAPWTQRVLFYFVVMPLLARAKPLRLVETEAGKLELGPAVRTLNVDLGPGERCWARAAYVRPVTGKTNSQWLFDWGAPLVSYAAGLSVLTRITGEASGAATQTSATLASPTDADSYLMELRFSEHPGFVFHPRHLVAVTGDVKLWTTWRIWSVHSWLTGQLRYIGVKGTGRCVLEGFGDVVAREVSDGRSRIEQELVLGFDARLRYATARTETFLPYFLGRTPLVDDVFSGRGVYVWQKNTHRGQRTLVDKWLDFFFGAVGKLLGF